MVPNSSLDNSDIDIDLIATSRKTKLRWIPKMMVSKKVDSLKKLWPLLVSMLDFWGVQIYTPTSNYYKGGQHGTSTSP